MAALHGFLRQLFAGLLDPFARLDPLLGLSLISAVSGVLILIGFRFTSNPKAIRGAKQKVQAHLLAVRLYRDDLTVVFRAQRSLLLALALYMGNMVKPFLALLLPFALLFAHLDTRYGARALHPGERALVKAATTTDSLARWTLEGDGVAVESPPVRIPSRGEIAWRVRAKETGSHRVTLVDGERKVEKEIRITQGEEGVSPRRSAASFGALFLAPTEPAIDSSAGVEAIEITYPALHLVLFGWHLHWIVVFLVVSAAVALLFRRWAGVEF